MADLPAITRAEMRRSAHRELRMRQSVYPHEVARGRMTAADATHELRCQEAIVRLLDALGDEPLPGPSPCDLFGEFQP